MYAISHPSLARKISEVSIFLSGLLPAHVGLYVEVDIHVVPQQIIGCKAFSTLVAFERFVLLCGVDSPHVLLQVLHLDHHPHGHSHGHRRHRRQSRLVVIVVVSVIVINIMITTTYLDTTDDARRLLGVEVFQVRLQMSPALEDFPTDFTRLGRF